MPITTRHITNVGSPPDDPGLLLPGNLYIPDPLVHPQPWPCIVATVAGGFHQGAITTLGNELTDLANAGFLCLAHTVRLLGDGVLPGQTTDGMWHQQTDDLKIGIRYMRSNPGGFGYNVTGFVGAIGGSGSAHHAMYCALDGTLGDDKLDAAVCMSPPTDFSDRQSDVAVQRPAIITIMTNYARVTDLPTLLARSPISLPLATASPILHFNGNNEGGGNSGMALSMLTLFSTAIGATAGAVNYTAITNTGLLGRQHSFAMWSDGTGYTGIAPIAIAWLISKLPTAPVPVPVPVPIPSVTQKATVLTVPLQAGTLLANVRYRWIINGVQGPELSDGITQPSLDFPEFRFSVIPPPGAEELVVYDVTDITNWNVGGFKIAQVVELTNFPAPVFGATAIGTTAVRSTPFRKVFEACVRLLGIDPRGKVSRDVAITVCEHINARVQSALLACEWPEWTATEERAFRQVWNPQIQYYSINAFGVPDEVFYIPTLSYYKVFTTINPDKGLPPVDTNLWEQMTTVQTYVEYDQPNKRSFGEVLGVYATDPSAVTSWNGQMLRYQPNERGLWVQNASGPTVFIHYKFPIPEYTMEPFIPGLTYNRGDVMLDLDTNECFQALDTVSNTPIVKPDLWRRVPFLSKWREYVKWGAYADSIMEVDRGGSIGDQGLLQKQANAEQKALNALQQQIDSFAAQGQKLTWRNFNEQMYGGWFSTQPWTAGGTVTTLTDEITSSMGWVYPFSTF